MPDSAPTDATLVPIKPTEAVTAAKGMSKDNGGSTNQEHSSRALAVSEAGPKIGPPVSSQNPDLRNQDTPQPYMLKDIQVGNLDSRGFRITTVYAVQPEEYAIYQAGEVMAHFADEPVRAQAQRKSILPLSSARAEVNTLLSGLSCREICDRQLAYALQLALDGATSDWPAASPV